MERTKIIIIIVVLTLAFPLIFQLVHAEVLAVPDDYESIRRALDASQDGDTVLVKPGTYVENIRYFGNGIVIGSMMLTTGNEAYIDSTIIDGNENGPVVAFFQSAGAKLIGFTIQNGSGMSVNGQFMGGGILMLLSNAVIEHCKIRDNHVVSNGGTPSFGGGITCYGMINNSSPTIRDCEIYMNSSDGYGGGISIINRSNPTIERVIIRDDSAVGGGGILILGNYRVTISNCVISENVAGDFGGGIFVERTMQVDILNVTIVGNSCSSYGGGVLLNANVQFNAVNSMFWDNDREELSLWSGCSVSVSYCDIDDGEEGIVSNDNSEVDWGNGNIDSDPLFLDAENDDYHLTENSPCIDTGTAFLVWEEDTLINMTEDEYEGFAPDMGAFESEFTDAPSDPLIPHPSAFILNPAYPNPFNSTTMISYQLPNPGQVSLQVYNLSGERVSTLFDGYKQPGSHKFALDANGWASGVYMARLQTGLDVRSQRLVLVR